MFEWLTVEWLTLAVTVVVALGTAFWALYTWTQQRKRDREQTRDLREKEIEQERKRRAALYVYPFLLACEDLQSRLYNIIENVGLEPLNKHYPDGRYAEEILYMVAQYFAWQQCIYRYTSYAQDGKVIELTEAIRGDFATDKFGV